jgi:hypothetical protein
MATFAIVPEAGSEVFKSKLCQNTIYSVCLGLEASELGTSRTESAGKQRTQLLQELCMRERTRVQGSMQAGGGM